MAKYPGGKGRPATSGTRYGNGRGHGGPAKGAGKTESLIEIAGEVGPDSNPSGMPGYRALARAERLEILKESLWDDAFDPDLPQRDRHAARESLLNREEGLPVARVVNTDDADKWFIEGGREAETVEEWQQKHSLATARPAGSAD